MKKQWIAAALIGCALTLNAHAQAAGGKKELVAKVISLQQQGIEVVARGLAERPALQIMQAAAAELQRQPADKREALAKQIEGELRKYVEEATPLLRDRALKLAPTTIGPVLEDKFSEDELRQLVAWLESPVNRKFQQNSGEMQNALIQALVKEGAPIIDPKLQALQDRIRAVLGVPAPTGRANAPAKGASR